MHMPKKWDGLDSSNYGNKFQMFTLDKLSWCLSDQSLEEVRLRALDDDSGLSNGETSDEEVVGISSDLGAAMFIQTLSYQ